MAAKNAKNVKAKGKIIEPDEDEELEEEELEEETEEDAAASEGRERDLAAVVAALGGEVGTDILLKIYRKDSKTNKREWVVDARPEDMPLEGRIQAEFGGGSYEVDVFGPTPQGSKSRKCVVPMPIAARRDLQPGSAAAPQAFDLERVMTKMAEVNASTMKQMAELLTLKMENMVLKAGGGGGNALTAENLVALFGMFREMNPQSKSSSIVDMVKELAAMKEVFPDLFGGGGGNGMTGWDALTKAVESLASAAKSTARLPAAAAQPGPEPAPGYQPELTDVPNNTQEGDMFTMILRARLQELCEKAAADRDPAVYAQVAADDIPEAYYGKLMEFLGGSDDKAVEQLIAICPQVAQFRAWFVEFCAELRAEILPPAEDEVVEDLTTAAAETITGETDPNSSTAPNAATNSASGAGNPSDTSSHT